MPSASPISSPIGHDAVQPQWLVQELLWCNGLARSSARADTALLQRTYMQEIHFVPLPPHRPSGRSSTPDPRPHLRARSGYEYSCVPPHLHTPSPWPTICRRPTPASRPSFLPRRRPITVLLFSLSLSLSLSLSATCTLCHVHYPCHAPAGGMYVCYDSYSGIRTRGVSCFRLRRPKLMRSGSGT